MPIQEMTFGTQEVCRSLQISSRQLEYWVLIGVVDPILEPHGKKLFRRFTRQDIQILKRVKDLTDEGFLVSKAAEKVRAQARPLSKGGNGDGWTG